jgi:MraZ protein
MFRGNHKAKVDDKGRLKIPSAYKERIDEVYGPEFFITSLDGTRAILFPLKEWEKKEALLEKMPSTDPARIDYLEVTSFYGGMATMDEQGRVLLPALLREKAKLLGDVAVLGKQQVMEAVDFAVIDQRMNAPLLTQERLVRLAEFGI